MPFSTILVPVDGSLASKKALKSSISVAKILNISVRPMHVVTFNSDQANAVPPEFSDVLLEMMSEEALQERNKCIDYGTALLEGAQEQCSVHHVTCQRVPILFGEAAEEILNKSDEFGPTCLIVMGSHGRKSYQRWTLGSVAESVIRNAKCCVLTVRASNDDVNSSVHENEQQQQQQHMFKKILLPYDFGELSKHALEAIAIPFSKAFDAEIILFHHFEINYNLSTEEFHKTLEDTKKKLNETIRDIVAEVGVGRLKVEVSGSSTSTADIIIKHANMFDMIVMGTHGRSGLMRLLLGSIAEKVLRETTTPLCLINHLVQVQTSK